MSALVEKLKRTNKFQIKRENTVWLLINNTNTKKPAWRKCLKMFLETIFRIRENFSQSFWTKFLSLFYMMSLAYKISQSLSANHNPDLHWRDTFSTDVTLSALVLHLNCTVLSETESSNFFMCITIEQFLKNYHWISRQWNKPSRVAFCLSIKTSLSAKPFIWKWVLHAVSFSCKSKSFS